MTVNESGVEPPFPCLSLYLYLAIVPGIFFFMYIFGGSG